MSANSCNFLATTHKSQIIPISASKNDEDIPRFIELEVKRLSSEGLLLGGRIKPKLRHKTVKKLKHGAQGMFRWVALSLETLQQIKHPKDFEEALGQLPSKLSDLYNIIHEQIDKTEPHGRNVAITTLKWLLCAQHLLSVRELIVVVLVDFESEIESVSDSDIDSTSEQISSTEDDSESEHYSLSGFDIIQFCRNLV